MKRGFTLIELSIVLVIIGLLIGGILVAQSMIQTAKIQSYVKKFEQYEIAIRNFKTAYGNVEPGDSKFFVPPGDADGYTVGSGPCNGVYSGVESRQTWAHLSQAGMIKDNYPSYSPASCTGPHDNNYYNVGKTLFPSLSENKLWFDIYAPTVTNTNSNIPIFYSREDANHARAYESWLPPMDLLALDTKIDDGTESSRLVIFLNYLGCTISPPSPDTLCYFSWYPDGGPPYN